MRNECPAAPLAPAGARFAAARLVRGVGGAKNSPRRSHPPPVLRPRLRHAPTGADCRESDSRLSRTRREAEASLGPLPPRRLCRACLQRLLRPCISSDNTNPQTTHVFRQYNSSDNTILQTTQQTTHNKTDTPLTSIRLTSITPGPDSFSASLISVAASASPSASMIAA